MYIRIERGPSAPSSRQIAEQIRAQWLAGTLKPGHCLRFNDGMSYAYIACFPVIHALMYALAVLGTCVFRRPLKGRLLAEHHPS